MDLAAWLNRIEQLHPQEIDLGLERVAEVWRRLNVPLRAYVITVAGTNGKGSTVAALQAAAVVSKINVCAFTSPHILRYNERISLNGQPASDEILCQAFEKIDLARGDISLSYFEFNTLAALLVATEANVDLLLLEVGLGGRLDAVNIIDADMAVITSIALDHEDWLGSDLNVIAAEKAGVSREGRPVVVGQVPDLPFWETFYNRDGETYVYGRDFGLEGDSWWSANKRFSLPVLSIPRNSVALALQVIQLCPLFTDLDAAERGCCRAQVFGRMQCEQWQGREVLFDVAHNPASVELLAARLADSNKQYDAVFACMADKAIQDMLPLLAPFVRHWYLPQLRIPRAAAPSRLEGLLGAHNVTSFASTEEALQALEQSGSPILVAGSFFTVSEVMAAMGIRQPNLLQEEQV